MPEERRRDRRPITLQLLRRSSRSWGRPCTWPRSPPDLQHNDDHVNHDGNDDDDDDDNNDDNNDDDDDDAENDGPSMSLPPLQEQNNKQQLRVLLDMKASPGIERPEARAA